MKLLECVPNVSEGRDKAKIKAFANAIRSVEGVHLLHIDSGIAAHRTVYTFAGPPEKVVEAAFRLYKKVWSEIDMRKHQGIHPRQGAIDVCPLVPLKEMTMEEAVHYSQELVQRIGSEIGTPGYFYEFSATSPSRRNLAVLRKGEYESLPAKFTTLTPDFGNVDKWEQNGATVIGARNLLIAYNVNLNTHDASVACQIAENVRESGKLVPAENGETIRIKGRLQTVKGLGWYIEDFRKAQVSYNLTDITRAGILDVFLTTCEEAEKLGFEVTGSELIGLAPLSEFEKVFRYLHPKSSKKKDWIEEVIRFLGLNELMPFKAEEKIIEWKMATL